MLSNTRVVLSLAFFAGAAGCITSDGEPEGLTDVVTEADPLTDEEQALVEATAPGKGAVTTKAVDNLHLVTESSETSSTWWRSPIAYCGYSNRLVGMGSSQPSNGSILFRGIIPRDAEPNTPVGTHAAAQEDLAGTPASWSMTAYAMCATPPPGLEFVEVAGSSSSSATRTTTAQCPGGKRVIGAGGTITGGNGRIKVDEIRPNEGLTQVTVTASEDQDGTSASWRLRAYAICANPPAGLVRVTTTAPSGWDGRTVRATCPSEKVLLSASGGVDVNLPTTMRVYDMIPTYEDATVRVTTKGDSGGASGEVRAYAICADG
jgi:hypothetical protein